MRRVTGQPLLCFLVVTVFCLLLIANSRYATKGPRQLSEFMYPCGSSVTLVNIENV